MNAHNYLEALTEMVDGGEVAGLEERMQLPHQPLSKMTFPFNLSSLKWKAPHISSADDAKQNVYIPAGFPVLW